MTTATQDNIDNLLDSITIQVVELRKGIKASHGANLEWMELEASIKNVDELLDSVCYAFADGDYLAKAPQ